MYKRILECDASDFARMDGQDLVRSIRAAEGRTIVAEVASGMPLLYPPVSNAELAAAFGADLILLNMFDVFAPSIMGVSGSAEGSAVERLKQLIGRPVGINLEPVDEVERTAGGMDEVPRGRRAEAETLEQVRTLGLDFVCLTGNPRTGVTNHAIVQAVKRARAILGPRMMIIAGKMHSAGIAREQGGELVNDQVLSSFIAAGADVVLIPAPGTVPGVTVERATGWVRVIHEQGALAMLCIGTSQESADPDTIRSIALMGKMTGADMFHIGDAGPNGVAPPENIMAYSVALRGKRHTYRRLAASPLR